MQRTSRVLALLALAVALSLVATPALATSVGQIAYLSPSRGLMLANSDGTGAQVLAPKVGGGALFWSPEGTRLATVYGRYDEVYTGAIEFLDFGTGRDTRIEFPGVAYGPATPPAWEPGGNRVVYVEGDRITVQSFGALLDLTTGVHTRWTQGEGFAWRPGTDTVAFVRNNTVLMTKRVSDGVETVIHDFTPATGEFPLRSTIAWSADGQYLYYTLDSFDVAGEWIDSSVNRWEPASASFTTLSLATGVFSALSPDGHWLSVDQGAAVYDILTPTFIVSGLDDAFGGGSGTFSPGGELMVVDRLTVADAPPWTNEIWTADPSNPLATGVKIADAGHPAFRPTLTALPAARTTAITINSSASSVRYPAPFVLSGVLRPGFVGDPCGVEVKKPGSARWSYSSARLAYSTASAGGANWWYRYGPKVKGVFNFRVAFVQVPGRMACVSRTISVRVR